MKTPAFEEGIWNLSILDRTRTFQRCIVIASASVGTEVIAKSYMESSLKTVEINTTGTPGLAFFVQVDVYRCFYRKHLKIGSPRPNF